MDKKELVWSFIKDREYFPMKFKEIAKAMEVPEEEVEILGLILDELTFEHKIIKDFDGRYFDAETNGYVFGTFSYSGRGYGFLRSDDGKGDVFIPPDKTLSALSGDKVFVKLMSGRGGINPEGEVYRIVERVNKTVVGTVQINRKLVFVIPDNDKLGTDIFITNKGTTKYKNNMKVVVRINKWPNRERNASGDIIEVLGYAGENEAEVLSVIKDNSIRYIFNRATIEEAEKKKITDADYKNREDFRNKTIITIDGEDAKDLDDAVGIERVENGYRLYVHIADVSHFVRENSELDKEAILRGTSVYFADRVIPMLPEPISSGVCSLHPGEDKLTLSVVMDINSKGDVINSRICEGVIKTNHRMSYNNVYGILNGDKELIVKYNDIYHDIMLMSELADILTEKRRKRGYINFNFPESKFIFDEDKNIIDIQQREFTKANLIIEEFMLLCNETVAEFAFWNELPFVYRIHEKPDDEKLDAFKKILNLQGYTLKPTKEVYPNMFNGILESIKGEPCEKVINTMLLRAMMKAKYSPSNMGHFGLALKNYCHFTSPIRRYPDLAIHRILKKYIKNGYNETEIAKLENFVEKASVMSSEAEVRAQTAERKIEDIKKAEYMEQFIGEVFEGVVCSITNFGLFVEFENTTEGLLRFADIDEDYFEFNKDLMCATGERTGKTFKIGDKIEVVIAEVDKRAGEIKIFQNKKRK